jgi:KDO2-lipid IV(A) lauroyltransferase
MAYYFYYGLFWLISLIPLKVLYLLADLVQPIVKRKYRRKVVNDNLAKSFPEKSEAEREKIADDFYHMLCDYMVEDIKLFSMSKKKMMKRMTFSGLEHIKEGFDSGKDYMFAYLGHFGNWEWIASLQYWMPYAHCSQIYHPLYNKVSDRIFLKLREQYGGECIPMKKTLRRILEIKKNGENVVVGFISDQQPKWNSIHHFSPFLNRETAVFTGTEVLAKKLGAMVYYARVTRPSRGHYHCEFIPMTHTPADYKDFDLTDLYMSMLEKDIRTNPHLWLWTHKRWRRTKEEWLRRQQEGK